MTTVTDRSLFRRLAGPGLFVGLGLGVALSTFGDTPDPRSTTTEIADYFVHHRVDVFVGVALVGIASMAVLYVVSVLAAHLRTGGQPVAACVAQSSATVVVGAIALGLLLPYASLSYIVGAEAPELAKGLFATTILTTPVMAFPLSACLGAIALGWRRARLGPTWFVWFTAAGAMLLTVAGCSFASSGAFSPDVQQQVLFQVLTLWLMASALARP